MRNRVLVIVLGAGLLAGCSGSVNPMALDETGLQPMEMAGSGPNLDSGYLGSGHAISFPKVGGSVATTDD